MKTLRRVSSYLADQLRGGDSSGGQKKEDDDVWVPGSRYKALQSFNLHVDPWPGSQTIGTVHEKEDTLVLDVWRQTAQSPLYAYVASTRTPEWRSGWVQLEGSFDASSSSTSPSWEERAKVGKSESKLGKQRQRGSWEVGGRYAVLGAPLLRVDKLLQSEHLGDVRKDEEVLIVELAVVMHSGEPRLRGRVRSDSGLFGWLTVELPWGGPLLRPLNLYSEEALVRAPSLRRMSSCTGRSSGKRLTLTGTLENSSQAWEVGGRYRLLSKVTVHEDPDTMHDPKSNTRSRGDLKKGALVDVLEKKELKLIGLCLRVCAVGSCPHASTNLSGWIPTSGKQGAALLDARDHTEYDKVMRMLVQPQQHSPSRVPRLELEALQDKTALPPKLVGTSSDGTESDLSDETGIDTDLDEETEQEPPEQNQHFLQQWSSKFKSPRSGGKDADYIDSLAVVLQSPRELANVIRNIQKSSSTLGNNFIEAKRKPFLSCDTADDNEIVGEARVDGSSFAPSSWFSCSTCCGGDGDGTGVHGVPPKVKTSGAAPKALQRIEEHEQLSISRKSPREVTKGNHGAAKSPRERINEKPTSSAAHLKSMLKLPLPLQSNGGRQLPLPPDNA